MIATRWCIYFLMNMTLGLHMEHCVLPVMLKPATQKDQSGQIKAVIEPLFGSHGHSIAWQVGGDHFSTLRFHKLLIIYTSFSLKHSLLLALRTYYCFYVPLFFSCFQLVNSPWGSLLEHLLTSLLSASKFSTTPRFQLSPT